MDISELYNHKVNKIKVRGLVKCNDEYIFIRRIHPNKKKPYLVFPGGRLKKSDRISDDKQNIGKTLKQALTRELEEELAAREIVIGELIDVKKFKSKEIEVLYHVDVSSIDWENKQGKEFSNPNKGTYELVRLKTLEKDVLGRSGYRLKPKKWRKLILNKEKSSI